MIRKSPLSIDAIRERNILKRLGLASFSDRCDALPFRAFAFFRKTQPAPVLRIMPEETKFA
ncbi:MAG TPA: hypothetical protein DEB39_01110 [Planctomycetaceae bacterium]|nr:hypothetical protein [Planctomycetaceae bacterium]